MNYTYEQVSQYMNRALSEAKKALQLGEVPVGAVIVKNGEIIACAYNTREAEKNALHHAEVKAIDEACKRLGGWRLHGCDMFVTLEPCVMCAGAIVNARIDRVFYGAKDEKAGGFGTVVDVCQYPFNHIPTAIGGIMENEASLLLSEFFAQLRKQKKG